MTKQIIVTWCIIALISTGLYASGDIENTNPYISDTSKGFYLGLGVSAVQANSYLYDEGSMADITIRAGYTFSKYFAIEFRGSKGVNDDKEISHDYSYGLYLKPKYPINENLDIYGMLGYALSKITFEDKAIFLGEINDYTTQNDFSYGLGLEYKISKDLSLFVDALQYIDEDTTRPEGKYAIKVNTLTLGATYHF